MGNGLGREGSGRVLLCIRREFFSDGDEKENSMINLHRSLFPLKIFLWGLLPMPMYPSFFLNKQIDSRDVHVQYVRKISFSLTRMIFPIFMTFLFICRISTQPHD